jgi:hypothetical protein
LQCKHVLEFGVTQTKQYLSAPGHYKTVETVNGVEVAPATV